jgi:hypothetical protein
LYGSTDSKNWEVIDRQAAPDFTADKKLTIGIQEERAYNAFKFEFTFTASNQIKLAEIELHGVEYVSAPTDLRAKRLSNSSIYLDWSCPLGEVDHFVIERSIDGASFDKVADVSAYEISYVDESLVPGAYYYRVSAVSKNVAKANVVSNRVHVNTTVDGLNVVSFPGRSFYETAGVLGTYPHNQVKVYSIVGQKMLETHYGANNLLGYLPSKLRPGVYIVSIDVDGDSSVVLNGKIVVH